MPASPVPRTDDNKMLESSEPMTHRRKVADNRCVGLSIAVVGGLEWTCDVGTHEPHRIKPAKALRYHRVHQQAYILASRNLYKTKQKNIFCVIGVHEHHAQVAGW